MVEACASYPDEDALEAVRPPPNVAILELEDSIKPLLTWLGNLTNWLSVLTMGRIVARRKDPMLGMSSGTGRGAGGQPQHQSRQQQCQQQRGGYGGDVYQQQRGGGYGRGAERDDVW